MVAATGNDGTSDPTFPAGDRGVIGVSATDISDNLVSFSNYGQDVFLAAPGVDIETIDTSNSYTSVSGTSSSAAIVAGVAAFMRAVDPTLTNGIIVGRIARTADPAGTQEQTGNGRVNMARALADTSIDPIEPIGAPGGGPYVGPYVIAGQATSVSGTVTSSATGNPPIQGAIVTCTSGCNNSPAASQTTDGSGDYVFDNTTIKLTFNTDGPVSITLTATAIGYQSQSLTISVSNKGSYPNENFQLTPSCTAPSITTQPANATVTYGEASGLFTAAASLPSTVQWQVSTDNGTSYTNITGATATTLTIISPTVALSGNKYRAVFSNCSPAQTETSATATLTVNKADPIITATGNTCTYNGAACSGSGSATGGASETLAVTLSYNTSDGKAPVNAGDYVLTVSFAGDANNNSGNKTAAIKINKADATISVVGYTGIYDGNAHGATGSATGVKGESLSGLYLGTSFTNVPGGTANWTFTDVTGNYNNKSGYVAIVIQAWTPKGFYQPVDMSSPPTIIWNTVKNGSTVPLKFEVFAGSTELTDVSKVNSVTSALVACTAGTEDAIEEVITNPGGTVLRYDTTGGQFIDNWKTPNTANKCYRVTMTTQDGSSLVAYFKLK